MIVAALTFFIVSGLLLWAVVYAKGWWQFKLGAMIVVPAFMFAVWFAFQSFSGYPYISSETPKRALYVSGFYVDPDPQSGYKGAIYMWVILPQSHSLNPLAYDAQGDPRSYKLPYDPQTAQQIQKANEARAKGQQVEIRKGTKGKKKGSHAGGGKVTGGKFTSYILPVAQAPQKHS